MSELGPRYEEVYRFGALLGAFRLARRAKKGKGGEPAFYLDLERNLLGLSRALESRTFRPDPFRYFTLRNKKERVVSEASFRDRVVHHALVGALEPWYEAEFIDWSYACRMGKGTHAALARASELASRHRYALRMDVRRYFESVDHEILIGLLAERVRDEGILWLCRTLLDGALENRPESKLENERDSKAAADMGAAASGCTPSGARRRGLPIGNLTSQFWANVYLHPVDLLVTRRLGRGGSYLRYMDDLVLFGRDKAELWEVASEVKRFASMELRLVMKGEATVMAPVSEGVAWLGCRVYPGTTRLDRTSRLRFARRIRESCGEARRGPAAEDGEVAVAASLAGHVAHASTLAFRRSVMSLMGDGVGSEWRA
ncbi:MAG: reverse transcriptase/maturase family protein [Polyangia bacterium]|jgi:hypothetical protein|nr:reverse transcriptase/maturase family protein [Polyangia bacterium]